MKKFIWCERSSNSATPIKGPAKKEWQSLIGLKHVHTLEELAKLPITEVLKYRIDTATEGVTIGIHQVRPNVDLAVRRLSEDEIKLMEFEMQVEIELAEVTTLIAKKEPQLHAKKVELEKSLAAARQRIIKLNLVGVEL